MLRHTVSAQNDHGPYTKLQSLTSCHRERSPNMSAEWKMAVVMLSAIAASALVRAGDAPSGGKYAFDGRIPQAVLENYLARSITAKCGMTTAGSGTGTERSCRISASRKPVCGFTTAAGGTSIAVTRASISARRRPSRRSGMGQARDGSGLKQRRYIASSQKVVFATIDSHCHETGSSSGSP
jgi:hypothetical protein